MTLLIAYIVTLVCGFFTLCCFLKLRVKGATPKACSYKSVVSLIFILSWFLLYSHNGVTYALLIGVGLIFGMLGDIWLDLKYCYPDDDEFYTKLGFGSFAFGHFAYIAAIILGAKDGFNLKAFLCSLGVAIITALVVYFGEGIMKLKYGKFKIISTLYGALLFFVTAFALFTAIFEGFNENLHIFVIGIGGVFFAISDLILSGTYFGEGKNRPVDVITNHVTYYMAQFIIAGSLWFIK